MAMEEDLTALLAGVAGGRRFWVRAPQGAVMPFAVLNRIDSTPSYTMQGPAALEQSRVQIDVYAVSYSAATTVARAVTALLSGYRAGRFQGIFVAGTRDLPAESAGAVEQLYRISIDIIVHYGDMT